MKHEELKMRIKIIAGYVLTTVFTLLAAWWVYGGIVEIVVPQETDSERIYEKSRLTTSMISKMYQVEYYGNRLAQSYTSDNSRQYKEALTKLDESIDSLRAMTGLSDDQIVLLDEISTLLKRKESNTRELARLYVAISQDRSLQHTLDRVILQSAEDSTQNVVIKSTVRNDTIAAAPIEKRTFLQRLGDAFVPQKRPATESLKVITTLKSDTLRVAVAQSDSLRNALEKVRTDVEKQRSENTRTIAQKLARLVATEQQISSRISRLIAELNQEAMQSYITQYLHKQSALDQAGRMIALIAIAAVLLIVVFVTMILRDINKSQRYKRQLEQARMRAEEMMDSRHRLLLNISHDIKAPLCSITGYLGLMENVQDERVRKYAEQMKISTGYILDLITNLLEYARMETGKAVSRPVVFDVDDMMEDVMRIFRPLALEKELEIVMHPPELRIGALNVDAVRVRQIVMNLVSNAVKFTDHGSVTLSYGLCPGGDKLMVVVTDTGCGIEPSQVQNVFDEFSRVESGQEGNGLGLSVVQGAVKLLAGEIVLESRKDHGSTFTVTIPIIRTTVGAVLQTRPTEPLTILIVDDDKLQLRMVAEMIGSMGHHALTAMTIRQVNQTMENSEVDMILSDLQMGSFSGYKLLRMVRQNGYSMPVVAVSASDRTDRQEIRKAGFDDFLRKPFSLAELRHVIDLNGCAIDLSSLRELLSGDDDAVGEILELFRVSTSEHLLQMRELLERHDFVEIRRLCHKMLPMFLQLGIENVASLLSLVEQSADHETDASHVERIITLTERALKHIPGSK